MDSELPRALQIIGEEWRRRRVDLAEWAMRRLVNRLDVWGQYTALAAHERLAEGRTYKALTLPQRALRGSDMVTLDKLSRHFGSLRRNHLIGLHAASAENTSRWLAIDIDMHDIEATDAEDCARRNLIAGVAWWEALQGRGYDPLLLDSNGAGGLHLLVLFAEPAPSADVHALGQEIVADWQRRNLDAKPETFPKSPWPAEGDKLGAWLRLPGLHHTLDHLTRVWGGDAWLDDPWLDGDAAIDTMLGTIAGPPPPASGVDDAAARKESVGSAGLPGRRGARDRGRRFRGGPDKRARVCVDLDGVLADYRGWEGAGAIAPPLDGAVEFTRRLAQFADITIHTARSVGGGDAAERAIAAWLDEHGFAWDAIHRGAGKPLADAYIDDRAVLCQPQEHGLSAFAAAEVRARQLAGKPQEGGADPLLAEMLEHWATLTPDQREQLCAQARRLGGG